MQRTRPIAPAQTPTINAPFLKAFRITHGPVPLLTRFFLISQNRLREKGLTVGFASFEELAALQRANVANWPFFNPMFDPSLTEIDPKRTFCLVARDARGHIVVTVSAKYCDATEMSFTQLVNSGAMCSQKPESPYAWRIAPSADTDFMFGRLGYAGAAWVDPAWRTHRLASLICHLAVALTVTLWDVDYVLGSVDAKWNGSGYAQRYGYNRQTPEFALTKDDRELATGLLLWMTVDDTIEQLARFVDVLWPEIDTAVVARGDQKQA